MAGINLGDLIISARRLAPDPPATLSKPASPTASAQASANPLATGTYKIGITAVNSYGETTAANPADVVIAAGQSLLVNATLPTGFTKWRVYFGIGTAGQYAEFTTSGAKTIDSTTAVVAATAPLTNTAYNPDGDGTFVTAQGMYDWLNEALEEASRIVIGIYDIGGFRSVSGQPIYELPGQWAKLTYAWFDGIPMGMPAHSAAYYRNKVTGISRAMFITQVADRLLVEIYPIPNRTGLSTTLASSMTATQTTAALASTTGMRSFGLAKIENEVVHYESIDTTTNTLNGLIRGLSGTFAAAHASAAAVEELNIRFTGLRNFYGNAFAVGDASKTLPVPVGWRLPLVNYLVHKFREAEQDTANAKRLKDDFVAFLEETARQNAQVVGPQQVPSPYDGVETYVRRLGGGIIVP